MKRRRVKKNASLGGEGVSVGNPVPDRVAKAFSIVYEEPDPEQGLEALRALLGEAQTEEERRALLGYGEVLQMRMMAGRGEANPD